LDCIFAKSVSFSAPQGWSINMLGSLKSVASTSHLASFESSRLSRSSLDFMFWKIQTVSWGLPLFRLSPSLVP
jgi:hypothetical protein